MKAELIVLTQGLCSLDLLQVLVASEIQGPEKQGMLELPKFPLLEAFVSYRTLGPTFLVWESPWNGRVPGSVCNSLLSLPVPLIFLVIVSSLVLSFISPPFFWSFFYLFSSDSSSSLPCQLTFLHLLTDLLSLTPTAAVCLSSSFSSSSLYFASSNSLYS